MPLRPKPLRSLSALLVATSTIAVPASVTAHAESCPSAIRVPGAQHQEVACLPELTTAGTVASGHTVPTDWAGLTPKDLPVPSGVPGVQIDGYFPDSSTTNTDHGWNHDAQFVIRLPDHWNGGLVVSGTPGVRGQYANDRAIGDWVLARGYAFAATDKGNTGADFYKDGRHPGDAMAEWNSRLTQLTRAAKKVVRQRYREQARRTLVTGMSNGGYLVRWQLENHPELYDGGVDWEGTLWRTDGPNLFTFLPPALRGHPEQGGFPADSSFLWPFYSQNYWGLTQRIYRAEFDPGYTGADEDYDYKNRPASVHRAVAKVALTGRIGKPLITIHGTLDGLLPISQDSDVYARLVRAQGRGGMFRFYRIEDGTHVDSLFDAFPDRLRPLVPCHRSAFTALERWLGRGETPPPSRTVPRPATDAANLVTSCPLG